MCVFNLTKTVFVLYSVPIPICLLLTVTDLHVLLG